MKPKNIGAVGASYTSRPVDHHLGRIGRALYGLPGRIVRAIAPETEADPLAILVQLLVSFGNAVGRAPYYRVGATDHHTNLYCVLVGDTASGKGASWDYVRALLAAADPLWVTSCLVNGLISAEGLVYRVRDVALEAADNGGKAAAPPDKRLLVVEAEFTSVLRAAKRPNATLSHVIRRFWDDGNVRTLAKVNPVEARDAHVSLVGHTTLAELRRELRSVEVANGFANRILWISVHRTRDLPNGGRPAERVISPYVRDLRDAVDFGRSVGVMNRSAKAEWLWTKRYPGLRSAEPGLAGAMSAKAAPQVLRLSAVYALLDHSAVIKTQHLKAAFALWSLAESSARTIFGNSAYPVVRGTVLEALSAIDGGVTRKEIMNLLKRNVPSAAVEAVLTGLRREGVADYRMEATGGRPAERWFLRKSTNEQSPERARSRRRKPTS